MVTKVRERLVVSKQETRRFDGERFNLRKLDGLRVQGFGEETSGKETTGETQAQMGG